MSAVDPAPAPALFASGELRARELPVDAAPLVQALFDANPAYFRLINGRDPRPDEAQREFDEEPPPHLSWTRRWFLGWFDAQEELVGVAVVVSDLGAARVWHLALFLLASRLHGHGTAQRAYEALETWAREQGAQWLRLGVVLDNARARRFWQRQGFVDLRLRQGVNTGGRTHDIHIGCKPLTGGSIGDYLRLVPRDAPGSTLD